MASSSFDLDDAAYAADIDGPAPASPLASAHSPLTPSFRRQRSVRTRDLASHLRHPPAPAKPYNVSPNVEPLGFSINEQSLRNSDLDAVSTIDPPPPPIPAYAASRSPLLLQSPFPVSPKPRFAFDDSFGDESSDDEPGDEPTAVTQTHDNDRIRWPVLRSSVSSVPSSGPSSLPSSLPTSPASAFSAASPRWASPASTAPSALFDNALSLDATVSAAVASTSLSTALTSPLSPKRASSPRFAGFSSHPFVIDALQPTAKRLSSSASQSSLPILGKPEDPVASLSSFPFPLPPTSPTSPTSSAPRSRTPTPATAPFSSPTSTSTDTGVGAMMVGNFSRPRKASIQKPSTPVPVTCIRTTDTSLPEAPPPALASSSSPWPSERLRGLSISSKASSSYSSILHTPSVEHLRAPLYSSTPDGAASPSLPRPPKAYSRTDSTFRQSTSAANVAGTAPPPSLPPSQALPQAPSQAAEQESRSSYRSQWTASTANRTIFTDPETARSSVLTKTSSRTSISWFTNGAGQGTDEGLSVDDVMGMYEKGFGDSTGGEDNDVEHPYNSTRRSLSRGHMTTDDEADEDLRTPLAERRGQVVPGPIGSPLLEAIGQPLLNQSSGSVQSNQNDQGGRGVDDSVLETPRATRGPRAVLRNLRRSSSVPNSASRSLAAEFARDEQLLSPTEEEHDVPHGKHDSAKMLQSDEITPTSPSTAPSGDLDGSVEDSRSSSAPSPSPFAQIPQDLNEDPDSRDRYGFRKQNQHISRDQYDAWNGPYSAYIGRRRRKWVTYMRDSGLITENPTRFPPPGVKTKRFIRKGIPPEWRGAAWFYYAGGPSIIAKHPGIYDQLISRAVRGDAKVVDIESIERDLHRTFPDNVKFQFTGSQQPGHGEGDTALTGRDRDVTSNRPDEPLIVSKLRRVLLAFSIYNPRIGYCQSLNFLAGLLLLFVKSEEQCFWLLNVITRIFLPGTHEMSLEGSKVDLSVLMATIQEALPSVWAKIGGDLEDTYARPPTQQKYGTFGRKMKLPRTGNKAGDAAMATNAVDRLPPITLCMTAWFMSCFIGTLPVETMLRVWDIFFYEGSKTLFRVALAIFKLGEPEIRAVTDPMEMFGVVQGLPRRMLDCNMLMETTFRRRNGFGHLSQEAIEEKRRERRDAFKAARALPVSPVTPSRAAATPMTPPAQQAERNTPDDARSSGSSNIRRKGTLFGRRRERRLDAEAV